MGTVWLARNTKTKKRVALKLLKQGASEGQGKRLLREARAAGIISHPNVREIFDVVDDGEGDPFIVMEYLEGRPLGSLLAEVGKLSIERAAEILVPVISAVGSAHTLGIVHRDLKPDNIFLVEHPAPCVKVVDFGIAKLTAEEGDAAATSALTGTGSIVGTPHFMAPEQVFGEKNLDHRVDVWALGLIAYRMLSGVLPTDAENVGQTMKIIVSRGIPPLASVAADVPADVAQLVDRMLQRSTRARLSSLHEAFEVMKRYAAHEAPDFAQPRSKTAEHDANDGPTTIGEAVDPHSFTHAPDDTKRSRPTRARAAGVAALAGLGALGLIGGGVLMSRADGGESAGTPAPSASAPVSGEGRSEPSASRATPPPGAETGAAPEPTPSARAAAPSEASATADSTLTHDPDPTPTGRPRATAKPRADVSAQPTETSRAVPAPTLTVQTAW
ncbi:MAG: protein kinase [Polyangiaceae bacterium]|jgi:serine/threonine protein kinase|nr:protein kinase [Polyangiaceae bacterium]